MKTRSNEGYSLAGPGATERGSEEDLLEGESGLD